MALSASTTWEVRSTGNSANGGGFNVGNANFPTDLTATSGTGSSPVVSSASYTFVAGDVGASVFIKSGTNWTPGFYPIASVSGGAATLTASIGSVNLYGGATVLNTAAGCATTASPTAGTFGVDYSQQASPQFTFTDLAIDGTTNTKFTSAANPVGKNFVGNILNVTSGTGFTVQRVEIVSTTGTTATCDKSLGTLSSTGGNGKLGGCLDGLVTLSGVMVASNVAFCTGSFTQTATPTFSASSSGATGAPLSKLIGYSTYRGDRGRASITLSTTSSLKAINCTGNAWSVQNFDVNCAGLTGSFGIVIAAISEVLNCRSVNAANYSIQATSVTNSIYGNECAGSAYGIVISGTGCIAHDNNVHDNSSGGISSNSTGTVVTSNLIVNNPGATGVFLYYCCVARNNTVFGNGGNGIYQNVGAFIVPGLWTGNILAQNGAYGLVGATAAGQATAAWTDGNAFYSNTSGARNNMDDRGTTNAISGVAPYVDALDVTLTSSPFVKASLAASDLAIDGTLNTKVTSGSYTFVSGDVGATIYISSTSGGWAAQKEYTILSVSSGAATLSASPGATSSTSGRWYFNDFRLNTTAGGGAACRAFGVPRSWSGNSLTAAYPDMGAVQHIDPSGGGSGGPVGTNFRGGFSNG